MRPTQDSAVAVPLLHFGERTHHHLCPTYPGAPLEAEAICADCIYGRLTEPRRWPALVLAANGGAP